MWHTLILQVLHSKKLANLKTEVDKLEIDKLAPVPVDFSKLSDVIKNDIVKKLCVIENKLLMRVILLRLNTWY